MSILQTNLHLSLLPRELSLGHLIPSGPRKCVLKWNFGASPKYFHYLEINGIYFPFGKEGSINKRAQTALGIRRKFGYQNFRPNWVVY